jgi:MOSC domain-containing protein YiiM
LNNGTGRIFQLSVSHGGVPKHRVESAAVTVAGMAGDRQADLRAHGGPERALCLWSAECIARIRAEGNNLYAGAAGENVTIEGIDWEIVVPGARINLGLDVVVEVTRYTAPCYKNARWFVEGDFTRMRQEDHPGDSRVYARVLAAGTLREGDIVRVHGDNAIDRVVRRQAHAIRWPGDFQAVQPG